MTNNESNKVFGINLLIVVLMILIFPIMSTLLEALFFHPLKIFLRNESFNIFLYGSLMYLILTLAFVFIPFVLITGMINYLYSKNIDIKYRKIIRYIYLLGLITLILSIPLDKFMSVHNEYYALAFSIPICIHMYLFLLEKYVKRYYMKENVNPN